MDEGTTYHVAISVDIDRLSDARLRRDYLPMFRQIGCETAEDIRDRCHSARAVGLRVFPPCRNVNEDGSCAGHSDAELTEEDDRG